MTPQYVEVAVPPPVARELTYRVPEDSAQPVQPGALVLVPVAGRRLSGIATRLYTTPPEGISPSRIRPLESVMDTEVLSAELIELCRWMASYYFAPLGSALMAALPPGLQLASNRLVRLTDSPRTFPGDSEPDRRILELLRSRGPCRVTLLRRRFARRELEAALRRLRTAGYIEILPVLPTRQARARTSLQYRLVDRDAAQDAASQCQRRAPRQSQCLEHLLAAEEPQRRATLAAAGFGGSVLAALEKRGLIARQDAEIFRNPLAHITSPDLPPLRPTAAQTEVIAGLRQALEQRRFHAALLHGVTGSGKTLVYMELVDSVLHQGRGAIVLVPEIALAWQMVRRFKARFGDAVAVLHSQLSPGERYDTWRRLRQGTQRLVIGARSAVLAPLPDLGLIVVDEEHDGSYKQEDLDGAMPLTYHARDVALVRGKRLGAVVVLGSATPSLESHWNAGAGKYQLCELRHRVDDRPLPRVQVVDMRQEPYQGRQPAIFSRLLRRKIEDRLARGEQVVLLQNRRGFSPFIVCHSCGEAVECAICHIALTFHQHGGQAEMRCHYCDYRAATPRVCPACGAAELRFQGVGTQRVEEALLAQFRGVRVIRMDVDTTGWKGAHDELVERFRSQEADILLGTQMVAKGLDFPEVTLVGVISADTGMHMPDFRAAERSFQLLTQVAGRSGRGRSPGEVVVQTLLPDDAVLRAAAAQDFATFAAAELEERREAAFPPFGRLALLRWRGEDEDEVARTARRATAALTTATPHELLVLGPAPAPLARLRGRYRYQVLLRASGPGQLHRKLREQVGAMRRECPKAVELTINVDPVSMM